MIIPESTKGKYPFKNLPGEEWAMIPEFGEDCLVSNMGRCVRVIRSTNQRFASVGRKRIPIGTIMGYRIKQGALSNNGYKKIYCRGKTFFIHRLVATAFVPNLFNYPEIDHINGIRDDNRASNLRWVNRSMNMANPITKRKQDAINEDRKHPVVQIDIATGQVVGKWDGLRDAAKALGFESTHIMESCRSIKSDVKHSCGGYGFVYDEEYDKNLNYKFVFNISPKSIIVYGLNGEIQVFSKNAEMARYYKVGSSIVTWLCRQGKPQIRPRKNSTPIRMCKYYLDLNEEEKQYIIRNFDKLFVK